jgi:hypothetical protein
MTLTCKWVKDRTGALVMKWTGDEISTMKPKYDVSQKNPTTPDHEQCATGLNLDAMLPAWFTPEVLAANSVPNAPVPATPRA